MTDPELTITQQLLKTDILGRVRTTPEHREKILDAFEASGMSGQAFAVHHGIKVQTFASWIQKRRRKRGEKFGDKIWGQTNYHEKHWRTANFKRKAILHN